MNLRQIELLRAVVRCETTVRAAQELGLSQPAVSNAKAMAPYPGDRTFMYASGGLVGFPRLE